MASRKRKLVKFDAVKTIKKPVRVRFRTSDGDLVSFDAIKTMKKPVKVKFYAKRKKRRR